MTDEGQEELAPASSAGAGRAAQVRRLTPAEGADGVARYLLAQRERLIIEIRLIEDLLGMPQSIPKRQR